MLAGFLLAWREKTAYSGDGDLVFTSPRLKGRKPLSASILVQKYLRPAAVKAGIIEDAVQEFLRQAHVPTTLQLYAQSDMESKRDAQGMFLKPMLGDRMHLLTEQIQ